MKSWQPGTGQWFLNHPQVAKWHSEANATLFCSGIPGAGKTMIAAIAVDHLLDSIINSPTGVAYVYCNYKEEQELLDILAAILKQLALPNMEPVDRLRRRRSARGTSLSLHELIGYLRDVVDCYDKVYIVIDALDECQDGSRRQLLTKLTELRTGRDIHLMATSRHIPEIEVEFNRALQLDVQASEEDVERFVNGQIHRLPRCVQRDPELQDKVRERIAEASAGM
jgi:Cdc6-like AAA superfamily ATPase